MGIKLPGTKFRKRLVVLFLLLTASSLYSLEMQILPDTLITGRIITLKIQSDIPDTEKIETGILDIPQGLSLVSGPIIRPYYKRVEGLNKRFHQITWALRSRESGIFTFPSVDVISENEVFNVEIPIIKVFNNDEKYNNYPLIVTWNKDIEKEIYVGESLPLIVEVYNLEEFNFPDRDITTTPRTGDIVKVSGLGDITTEKVGDVELYRVPVASWIYTPFEAGKVTIPSVRVDINGLTRYTESLTLNVLPVPKVNATGGVGEFMITTDLSETQVTPEDLFHYKVRISGQGNLPYIKFPQIDYPGLIFIEKTETEEIEYSDNGFLGWREIDYTLQALESGAKEISLSGVSWIDKNGSDIFYNGNITHLNVVSVKVVEEDILPFLSLMNTPEIISSYSLFLYKNPFLWLSLCISGFVLLIFSIFKALKNKRQKNILLMTIAIMPLILTSSVFAKGFEYQGELVIADNFIESGEYQDALIIYEDLSEKLPYNYGLFVNKAILWDKLDNISKAVYNIRIAERIVPTNQKVKQIKKYLSDSEESMQKQAKTSNSVDPDYIFLFLVFSVNLLVLVLYRLFKVKNITIYALFFMVVLFFMLSTIFLVYVDVKNSVDAGVISSGGASLTKVPNERALEWITLEEGNCVYIKGEWDHEYLIETEYGLQGWISKNSLLVLDER